MARNKRRQRGLRGIQQMSKDNVLDFEDFKLLKEAGEAIDKMEALFHEAAKYPDDPDARAFLAEWSGKMAELAAESEALMKEIEEMEKLQDKP
jgi:hypothetical protein